MSAASLLAKCLYYLPAVIPIASIDTDIVKPRAIRADS